MNTPQLEQLTALLAKRRDRTLGAILGAKERDVDPHLSIQVRHRFRKVILDEINEYHSMVLDVMSSLDMEEHVVLNDYWLQRIAEIHDVVMATNGSR